MSLLITPFILNRQKLVARFETNGKEVYASGQRVESGVTEMDFSGPVKYTVVSDDGEENVYTVTVNISGLPVVYINTPDGGPVTSKTDWTTNSAIRIVRPDGTEDYSSSHLQIKGRGNTTWDYPKKPYALKLDSKSKLLDMPKHKRWVLLANWMDRTLLRNDVTFHMAEQTCMDWTPRGRFVEVVMNGSHVGNYYLCEQIKVDEYMFRDPDEDVLQAEQQAYLQNFVNSLESELYKDDWLVNRDYATYMDLETFADWWLVHELSKNGEPNHPKSCYMQKDRQGVLKAGPVWDFDWGTYTPGTGFTIKNAIYYERLFSDPAFVAIVKARWAALKPKFDVISDYIRVQAASTRVSNQININRWPISLRVNGDKVKR